MALATHTMKDFKQVASNYVSVFGHKTELV